MHAPSNARTQHAHPRHAHPRHALPQELRDAVNERAVRSLLECILVLKDSHKKYKFTVSMELNDRTKLILFPVLLYLI